MFDPNNPMYQQAMNALAPQQQVQGWKQDYRNALMDWRGDRPMFDPATMQRDDFKQQLMDWRGLMPDRHDFRFGLQPGVQTNPALPPQPMPNMQPPMNPQSMVGSSYNVLGMTPATSPYGLPTY
jgi:hypothetical protein